MGGREVSSFYWKIDALSYEKRGSIKFSPGARKSKIDSAPRDATRRLVMVFNVLERIELLMLLLSSPSLGIKRPGRE